MSINKHVLLTGAGFTANFGTPLAADVHNLICNHQDVRSDMALKAYAETEPDYEQLFNTVLNGSFDPAQKAAIQKAIYSAYQNIDRILQQHGCPSSSGLSVINVQNLIACFRGSNGSTGVCFTLNQDLFLERHQYNQVLPVLPGITAGTDWFKANSVEADMMTFPVRLPNASTVNRLRPISEMSAPLAYVKLHGSCNWESAVRANQMVIGTDKTGQIAAEPLLAWYFEQFRHVLSQENVKLLCIGYGFRDDHVNAVIADAIENAALSLFVLAPTARANFTAYLSNINRGATLIGGLQGYFAHGLLEICPHNYGYATPQWQYLCDSYFDGNFKSVMGTL